MWDTIRDQTQAVRVIRVHMARRRIAPAYVFAGPDGVGKRLTALEWAQAINCDRGGHPAVGAGSPTGVPSAQREANQGRHRREAVVADGSAEARSAPADLGEGEACGTCGHCHRIRRHVHPDLHVLEVQGASQTIQIDDVRRMLGRIALRPYMGRRSVVIVDGAERLTEEAANSVLKALEEPPGDTLFLLLTVNPSDCLPTMVSRCQVIRFRRLSAETIAALLGQVDEVEPGVAQALSRLAQGSFSRARVLAHRWEDDQRIRAQIAAAVSGQEPAAVPPHERQELARWCEQTIDWLRDMAVASVADASLVHHAEVAGTIREQARRVDPDRCADAALEAIAWAESLKEQCVSPRLVATLLRESWLELAR